MEEHIVFDFGKKKRKKNISQEEKSQDEYEFLLRRIYEYYHHEEPEQKKMKPPKIYPDGTKRTIWANFGEICDIMNRSMQHVSDFISKELQTPISINSKNALAIKGRYKPFDIETIIKKYIRDYVKCSVCKSPDTHFEKELRLTFVVCKKCKSKKSVR